MNGAIKPFSDDLFAGVCLRIYQHSPARLKIFPVNDCNPDGTPDCIFFASAWILYQLDIVPSNLISHSRLASGFCDITAKEEPMALV
jgi:hypothetical protein